MCRYFVNTLYAKQWQVYITLKYLLLRVTIVLTSQLKIRKKEEKCLDYTQRNKSMRH